MNEEENKETGKSHNSYYGHYHCYPHYAVRSIRPDTHQSSSGYSEVKHQLKILQLPVNVRCFTVSYTATKILLKALPCGLLRQTSNCNVVKRVPSSQYFLLPKTFKLLFLTLFIPVLPKADKDSAEAETTEKPVVQQKKEGPSSSEKVDKMCKFIYSRDTSDRIRTRAMLCHVYHHALHDRWFEARDLMLMSHLQESIQHSDIPTQVCLNMKLELWIFFLKHFLLDLKSFC